MADAGRRHDDLRRERGPVRRDRAHPPRSSPTRPTRHSRRSTCRVVIEPAPGHPRAQTASTNGSRAQEPHRRPGRCASRWSAPGKGDRRAKVALTPATLGALHAYLEDRATDAGTGGAAESWRSMGGPLLATTSGGRMRPSQLWEFVRRLAAAAGIGEAVALGAPAAPHRHRHGARRRRASPGRAGLRPAPGCQDDAALRSLPRQLSAFRGYAVAAYLG